MVGYMNESKNLKPYSLVSDNCLLYEPGLFVSMPGQRIVKLISEGIFETFHAEFEPYAVSAHAFRYDAAMAKTDPAPSAADYDKLQFSSLENPVFLFYQGDIIITDCSQKKTWASEIHKLVVSHEAPDLNSVIFRVKTPYASQLEQIILAIDQQRSRRRENTLYEITGRLKSP
jgi:hypothetical protein